MADNLLPDYIKQAYEKELVFALKSLALFPQEKRVLTRKEKINNQIKRGKRKLGSIFSKMANKLGYYDDCWC